MAFQIALGIVIAVVVIYGLFWGMLLIAMLLGGLGRALKRIWFDGKQMPPRRIRKVSDWKPENKGTWW
jgi:hypothetical protein